MSSNSIDRISTIQQFLDSIPLPLTHTHTTKKNHSGLKGEVERTEGGRERERKDGKMQFNP